MFRSKRNKVPALSPHTKEQDTGTVRKNKKKLNEKDDKLRPDSLKAINETQVNGDNSMSGVAAQNHVDEIAQNPIEPNINLSRDELLKLLSVFEGELQARDEVIAILKSECSHNTETRYTLNSEPLKALQRDAASLDMTSQEDVGEQTKDQLKKIIQHQKESYKKVKQMHIRSQDKYERMALDLEEEKRKHQEYMMKSDDFVNLLEHDRERLKELVEQGKTVHDRRERELRRKLKENKEEVSRLKALSLELVDERQQQLQTQYEQSQLAHSYKKQVEELEAKVKEYDQIASSEKEHALQLENDLEEQSNKFYKENEDLRAKLSSEEAKSAQLEEKVDSVSKQMKKLKCVDKNLRKTDDQLWRIKEKLEQEEKYDDLLEEVELLRKTVADMQEAEKIYIQAQEECTELQTALQEELVKTRGLRAEVDKLKKSTRNRTNVERCVEESNFRFDEMKQMFEAECKKANSMKDQIDEFSERLKKIDETEETLKLSEQKLYQLNVTINDLRDEKSALETKFQLEKDKSSQYKDMLDDEQSKVTEVTQKMIEESKKVLKLKEQLATEERKRAEESEELRRKVEVAEESMSQMIAKEKASQLEISLHNLRKQVAMLKKRLDELENESDLKDNEARMAKEEAEKAKNNLKISTEKLKKLVAMGLNEQLAIAKCDEIRQKHLTLEEANVHLRKHVMVLEGKIQQHERISNTNNNNISLRGVAVTNISTQTSAAPIEDVKEPSSPPVRNVLVTRSFAEPSQKQPVMKKVPNNMVNVTKRDAVERNHSSWVQNKSKVTVTSQRKATTSATRTSLDAKDGDESGKASDAMGLMHGAGEQRCQSPVSMTISHDPSTETTPIFRIVRDTKTGTPHIETSVTDSKKGIQIRMTNKSMTETSSTQTRPPTGGGIFKGPSKGSKIINKVAVQPNSSNRTRSDSKTRKPASVNVNRRPSISPTRIPKLRSSTPTQVTPSSPTTSRLSRTATTTRTNR
ncbi:uncharacterized protein LOC143470310 isoform X2 [Clavelina lepadiformis]|uniref:uncharacterized protein LOC143470310 isoform X2 n=1 Tax=Clavelina lepadiformis TaxID=159417 RepID=UPI004042C171